MSEFETATEITMNAYQQIASNYAERHNSFARSDFRNEQVQRFAQAVRENPLFSAQPTLPVLDVGCGTGRDTLTLAEMDFEVLAVDLSEAMLDEGRRYCQQSSVTEHITFRQMDMRMLQLPDESCAGLWVFASLLHIPKHETPAVLREFLRVLLPGGPLTLVMKEDDGGETERYELYAQTDVRRFYARYRGSELWALLEQVGLRVIALETSVDTRFPNLPRWLWARAVKP